MPTQPLQALEQTLWPKRSGRDVWMIVDAARDRRIFGLLLECFYSDHTCLLGGPLSPELEVAAPYLVRLEYGNAKTQKFLTQAAGKNWGVYLKTDWRLDDLKDHLRGLLVVRDTGGNELFFRYYDPRVLRLFLPTCTADELRTVFGGIERFWIEDDKPETMLHATFDGSRLRVDELSLSA
jgi:hypothetical protein